MSNANDTSIIFFLLFVQREDEDDIPGSGWFPSSVSCGFVFLLFVVRWVLCGLGSGGVREEMGFVGGGNF